MTSRRVTLRDIAQKAGVTATTVSLALRSDNRISRSTREKVLRLVKEMGYRPNPLVSALMTQVKAGGNVQKGSKLAFLAPHESEKIGLKSYYTYSRDLIKAARQRAMELGYSGIDFFETERKVDPLEKCLRIIGARGIRGIILPPFFDVTRMPQRELSYEDIAIVGMGYSQNISNVHTVAHDQFKVTYNITQLLLKRGYKSIGMCLQDEMQLRSGMHYIGGFAGALFEVGAKFSPKKSIKRCCRHQPHETVEWVKKNKFDCIISQFPQDYYYLCDQGLDIPGKLGFALISVLHEDHNISGMFHDPVTLGYATVDLLTAMINRNEWGPPNNPKTVTLAPQWVEGETVRPG